jgi:group I intron endonuclease
LNGNSYVGSSVNLGRRFLEYFKIDYLNRNNMVISKALLKHGYSSFSLEILEYCEPKKCIEREQYYLDLLKPEYNILLNAGSLLGFKHSDEAIAKMSIKAKAKI